LSSNSSALTGTIGTQVTSSLSSTSISGAPGAVFNNNTAATQLTTRHWPNHNHTLARHARNRRNDGGYRANGGSSREIWRDWFWDAEGMNNAGAATPTSHSHSGTCAFNNVSGNAVPTHNITPTTSHNYTINVNGTPTAASVVNKHIEARFYIKY